MPINLTGNVSQALNAITAYNTKRIRESNKQIQAQTNPNELMKQKAIQSYWAEAWKRREEKDSAYNRYMDTYNARKREGMSEEEARDEARAQWAMEAETGIRRTLADTLAPGDFSGNIDKSIDNFAKKASEYDVLKGQDDVQKEISREIAKGGN